MALSFRLFNCLRCHALERVCTPCDRGLEKETLRLALVEAHIPHIADAISRELSRRWGWVAEGAWGDWKQRNETGPFSPVQGGQQGCATLSDPGVAQSSPGPAAALPGLTRTKNSHRSLKPSVDSRSSRLKPPSALPQGYPVPGSSRWLPAPLRTTGTTNQMAWCLRWRTTAASGHPTREPEPHPSYAIWTLSRTRDRTTEPTWNQKKAYRSGSDRGTRGITNQRSHHRPGPCPPGHRRFWTGFSPPFPGDFQQIGDLLLEGRQLGMEGA